MEGQIYANKSYKLLYPIVLRTLAFSSRNYCFHHKQRNRRAAFSGKPDCFFKQRVTKSTRVNNNPIEIVEDV